MLRQIGRGSLPASSMKEELFDFEFVLHKVFCRTIYRTLAHRESERKTSD